MPPGKGDDTDASRSLARGEPTAHPAFATVAPSLAWNDRSTMTFGNSLATLSSD